MTRHEAHVSAKQETPANDAWIPRPDANHQRPQRLEASPGKRAGKAVLVGGLGKKRFEAVFSGGKRAGGALGRIVSLPGEGRVGFATSKKIGAKPQRNRAKRRFREALRLQPQMAEPDLDIVVIISEQGARAPFAVLQAELGSLFNRTKQRWAEDSEYL